MISVFWYFSFAIAHIPGLDYSFSGLKTSFLYFVRDQLKLNENFIEENKADLAASMQYAIIKSLSVKVERAMKECDCKDFVWRWCRSRSLWQGRKSAIRVVFH